MVRAIALAAACGLLAPASLSAAKGEILCEGFYRWHLQGVATDGESLYWSFSDRVVKTDAGGKVIVSSGADKLHYGDLCVEGGVVYVAYNGGGFNCAGKADSRVRAFKASDLAPCGEWRIPEVVYGAGGMAFRDGRFYVVSGLPATNDVNHVYEYTGDFRFLRRIDIPSGQTKFGVQTIDFVDGEWLLGVYNFPNGMIRCAADFSSWEILPVPGYEGIVKFRGQVYRGGARNVKREGPREQGVLLPVTVPKRGSAVFLSPHGMEIVKAANAPSAVDLAARELSYFLERAFGAVVPVVSSPTPGRSSVFLGDSEWTRKAGIDVGAMPRDGFSIVCDGRSVYIAGRDGAVKADSLRPHFERATLFGVYEFLERFAGVRMYFPGELGTIVPKTNMIQVPVCRVSVSPAYTVRRWGFQDGSVPKDILDPGDDEAAFHRKEYFRLRGETQSIPCCHGLNSFELYRRFGKTHPEYFAMREDGTRWQPPKPGEEGGRHPHICYSSAVWDELFLDIKSILSGEPPSVRDIPKVPYNAIRGKFVDMQPQDGMRRCHCEKCKAAYSETDKINYASELVWGKTAELARRLTAAGVDAQLVLEAYLPYGRLPDFDLPGNLLAQVSRAGPWAKCDPEVLNREKGEIRAWAKALGHKVWLWTYPGKIKCFNVEMPDVPQMTARAWGEYFKSLSDAITGGFSEAESDRWLYNYLNYYVYSKVCWDPSVDLDKLLAEHDRLMFGAAAPFMRRFYDSLEHKWIYEIVRGIKDSPWGPAIAKAPKEDEVWAKVFSSEVLAGYAKLFDDAAAAVKPGSLEARRLALIRREFLEPMLARRRSR